MRTQSPGRHRWVPATTTPHEPALPHAGAAGIGGARAAPSPGEEASAEPSLLPSTLLLLREHFRAGPHSNIARLGLVLKDGTNDKLNEKETAEGPIHNPTSKGAGPMNLSSKSCGGIKVRFTQEPALRPCPPWGTESRGQRWEGGVPGTEAGGWRLCARRLGMHTRGPASDLLLQSGVSLFLLSPLPLPT